MIGLFEGGNSRLHTGCWNGRAVLDIAHTPYPPHPGDLEPLVRGLIGETIPERLMVCSVSSRFGDALFEALESLASGRVTILRTAADCEVTVRYEHPERYGIDRALAALAAYSRFHDSCVVVDAGTAVNVEAVDAEGTVIGGYIFPGAETLAYGLAARTGLPAVMPGRTGEGPGTDTESCISRGIAEGIAGAVRRLSALAAESVGGGNRVIVTGGDGEHLLDALPSGAKYVDGLVLEGLGRVVERVR